MFKYGKLRPTTFELRQQHVYSVVVVRSQFLNKSKNINSSTAKLFIRATVITTVNYGLVRSVRLSTVYYSLVWLHHTTAYYGQCDQALKACPYPRSKSKITRVTFVKEVNMVLLIFKTVYHKAFIFHMLFGLGENMSPGVFKFTRSKVKVTWVTFVVNFVNSFY